MKRKIIKIRRISLPVLTLLMVLLAACGSAIPDLVATDVATPLVKTQVSSQVPQALATDNLVPATDQPTPIMVATSRGANLEATDPSTVNLSSGQLQLVEFFRFTWSTCRSMAPMVHGLEAEYYGKVQFTFLDADDQATRDFQRTLGFAYQPEFYLLDASGNVLQKWFGYISEDEFRSVFAQYQ